MAFRADEEPKKTFERALEYLVPREFTLKQRDDARMLLGDITEKYGPVIYAYPAWHPLLAASSHTSFSAMTPSPECGYHGLDHTVFFAHAFITCPYEDDDKVISSVNNLPRNPVATITAEKLDTTLYHTNAKPVLVKCDWDRRINTNFTIPKDLAVPLMLERELKGWLNAQYGETWETMRPYLLGSPQGSRSSLFIDQETGQAMKTIWNSLIHTGMFGPIKV